MLLSVIVPAYNSEKTIEKCLKSILNQDYQNLEVIVVDDGSSDDTIDIIESLIKKDSRIHLFKQDNKGASLARRFGLSLAKGEYIGFVDSDDWIESDMYSQMIRKSLACDADIAFCKMSFDYKDRIDIQRLLVKDGEVLNSKEALHVLHNRIGIEGSMCNKIIKRNLFKYIRFPKKRVIGEDYTVMKQLIERAERIVCHNKLGYHYVQYVGSSALSGYNELYERAYYNYKRILFEARKTNDRQIINDIDNYMVDSFMWIILSMDENKNFDYDKIKWIQRFIRKRLFLIVSNKYNTMLCKGSALVLSYNYKVVAFLYKLYRKYIYVRA